MRWTVEVLDGRVEKEIRALPASLQARYLRFADMLELHGPVGLGMPHIRHLEGPLWEMRLKSRDGIARGVYVAQKGRRIVVLHVFIKKSRKTPDRALAIARQRLKELENG